MLLLALPDDLAAFLKEGRQLEYDPETCEAGLVELLSLDQLKLELFAESTQSSSIEAADPHFGEGGCYLVPGVNLVAACDGYEPAGILLWLPTEGRYAVWDSSHLGIRVFPVATTWQDIVKDPAEHINAQWGNWTKEETLVPWPRHVYCKKERYGPQPIALLNDPDFLRTCVPLSRSRRERERVRLVELLREAAKRMQRLGDTEAPIEVGEGTWAQLGQSIAEAAEKIAAGDKSSLGELWMTFIDTRAYEVVGLQSTAEEIFALVGSWLYPDHG
jgi:hypothetical protein